MHLCIILRNRPLVVIPAKLSSLGILPVASTLTDPHFERPAQIFRSYAFWALIMVAQERDHRAELPFCASYETFMNTVLIGPILIKEEGGRVHRPAEVGTEVYAA